MGAPGLNRPKAGCVPCRPTLSDLSDSATLTPVIHGSGESYPPSPWETWGVGQDYLGIAKNPQNQAETRSDSLLCAPTEHTSPHRTQPRPAGGQSL